jgi:TolB-like protein/tetratricopeptide (TPR) repeat protein
MRLHPNFPGWYWLATILNSYRTGEDPAAIDAALRMQMPGYFWTPLVCAAAYGRMGKREAAEKARKELLSARPGFEHVAGKELEKWFEPALAAEFLEGLRKAGLQIAEEERQVSPSEISRAEGKSSAAASRVDEGFWVAVLPFHYSGNDAEVAALAEGLTDDIVSGMSRFSYLRVIARSSTARYARETVDVRTAAMELGARYVMEGSLRQAGAKVRIATHLVDAVSGAGLWAETYDRAFRGDGALDLLDDVVPRIVATVADTQGILAHNMTEALRRRDPEQLTPYEAVLRSFGHHQRVNAVEHAAARTALERAVKQAPHRADCWAALSWIYREEYTHGFNVQPDSLGRALAAARRAVDAAPSAHMAHAALASTLFFEKDFGGFRSAAERSLALNSMDGYTAAYLGMQLAYTGDWERGCALAKRATELNPNHPGWYWFPLFFEAYRQRNYHGALQVALKVNMPGFWRAQMALAVAYAQLGQREPARAAVRELLKIRPDFAAIASDELRQKWHDQELTEHLMEGLRKAGLEIQGQAGMTSATGES